MCVWGTYTRGGGVVVGWWGGVGGGVSVVK